MIASLVLLVWESLTNLANSKAALDEGDLYCWCKWKWFLWAIVAAQNAEKDEMNETWPWYTFWGVFTSIPIWVYSQNTEQRLGLEAKNKTKRLRLLKTKRKD